MGAASSCVAALDSLQSMFRLDYPGYGDKVQSHEAQLAALTDSVRAIARTSDRYSVCIPALRRWTSFFHDPHIQIWQAEPPKPVEPPTARGVVSSAGAPAADDPHRPSIRYLGDSAAVLTLPDFEAGFEPSIDSLVAANRERLLATPYLVIDVRGNRGGCTCSYDRILPLLYTGPYRVYGADVWASAGNITALRGWLNDDRFPEEIKHHVRDAIERMRAKRNQFVVWTQDTIIARDTVYSMPRRVAVLVDGKCASSCEGFVMAAMQSDKVTVFGRENTSGTMDYGNVIGRWLPGWRRVTLPTTRGHLTPTRPLDNVGLAPHVRLPLHEQDVVAFALERLSASTPRASTSPDFSALDKF